MPKLPPTYAEFIARFPAFRTLCEAEVTAALNLSIAMLCASAWGEFYSEGVNYNTAHDLSMDAVMNQSINGGQQAAAGPITSSSAAGISVSFEGPAYNKESATEGWYSKTAYGQKFLRLRNMVIPMGLLTV